MKTEVVLKSPFQVTTFITVGCLMKTEVVLKFSFSSSLISIFRFNENRGCIEMMKEQGQEQPKRV